MPANDEQREFWIFLGSKYGYSPEAADRAGYEIAEILDVLNQQLATQKSKGSRFLVGDRLSAGHLLVRSVRAAVSDGRSALPHV